MINDVLSRLNQVRQTGEHKWQACCPAHPDKHASLSISVGDDDKVALFCHASCAISEILRSARLEMQDLFPPQKTEYKPTKSIKATYQYTDLDDNLLYESVRFEPKGFAQRKPNINGGWEWKLNGVRRVLFRLTKITEAAAAGRTVCIVEGEKDVITLENLGLIATTNAGGAGKWIKSYSETLAGARVIILPDNDAPGREHAAKVAESLQGLAISIKVLELPGLHPKGDVTDWIQAGGNKEELIKQAKITPEYVPTKDVPAAKLNALDLTDTANAERLVKTFEGEVLFNVDTGKWHTWTGQYWSTDDTGDMVRKSQIVMRNMYSIIPDQDTDIQPKLLRHIQSSLNQSKLEAMVGLAKSIESVSCKNDIFNKNPYLLCVENGIIDLQTSSLLPFEKSKVISHQINIVYSKDAVCPNWLEYLEQVQPDEAVREFLQRAVGYTLTSDVSEQCLFFCHGDGRNGKSTFIETISLLLGEYYSKTQAETLMIKPSGGGIPNDIACLAGKRMVSASELAKRQRLNESIIKDLTGGESISARFLHKEFFKFHAGFKLWLYGNEKPKIQGRDDGIWRRIKLIPWEVQIDVKDVDKHLKEKLSTELSGILTWAVEGCKKWLTEGLKEPAIIAECGQEYRHEQDMLSEFLEECCEFSPVFRAKKADLWQKYTEFTQNSGDKGYENQRYFNADIKSRSLIKEIRLTGGTKGWVGIKLKSDDFDYSDSDPVTHSDPNSTYFPHEKKIHVENRENTVTYGHSVTNDKKQENWWTGDNDETEYEEEEI